MKKIVLGFVVAYVMTASVAYCEEKLPKENTDNLEATAPKNEAQNKNDSLDLKDDKENKQKKAEDTKKSKWGYNIWGPMGVLKMVDFSKDDSNFAPNGILEVNIMAGPTYEMIENLKIGANIGIGAQFDINKVSYVVPMEANLMYDFNKKYSIFGGLNYSYGGIMSDVSIYIGTNLKGYSLRIGYIPYAFGTSNSSKPTGSGVYFSFAGLFI